MHLAIASLIKQQLKTESSSSLTQNVGSVLSPKSCIPTYSLTQIYSFIPYIIMLTWAVRMCA